MLTLRVSASDIDALRRFRSEEDGDLAALLAQLRREGEPTEAMRAGTAFHAILEHAAEGDLTTASADGYTFDLSEIDETLDLTPIREMKATRDYMVDGVLVTLVGKVDGVCGKRVDDHKFTGRYDAERFLGSYQWRIYLEVFGADEFRWNVFEGRESTKEPGRYTVTAMHPLRAYRYPGMGEDVERELRAFLDFARVHLPEKLIAEAA